MKITFLFIILSVTIMSTSLKAQSNNKININWSVAAELMNGSRASIGFAGMASGVSNDVLLIAGGANFPGLLPFQGGKKHFSDSIFILERKNDSFYWNNKNKIKLTEPIAYAGYATTNKGLVYVGGDNEKGISSKAYLLTWNKQKQQVEKTTLPNLPIAVTSPGVAAIGNVVYVACGDETANSSAKFFSIDLSKRNLSWKSLPDAPKALANGSLVAADKRLYLIGGRTKSATGISDLHSDVYYFDLGNNTWHKVADIFDGKNITPFTATAAFNIEDKYILLAGGDKGDVFHRIENYFYKMANTSSDTQKEKLLAEKNELVMHHQGFSTDVLLYDIKQNKWSKVAAMPYAAQVTTSAVQWKNDLFICSGEIRPGVRSPKIIKIQTTK